MFPNFPFTEDVCSTNKWKSSAAAREERLIFVSLTRNSKRLFVSKAKNLDRIDIILFG